jgi:aminopeptidase YwaD
VTATRSPGTRELISRHLDALCGQAGGRLVGTAGNRAATRYVRDVLAEHGLEVDCPVFDCLEWLAGDVRLTAGAERFEATPGPYSPSFDGRAELVAASTLDELAAIAADGRILLLHGQIAEEPLAPRDYVFYNPEHHQAVYRLMDQKRPAAVLSATGRSPGTAGATYPFALFDDGDFDVPSACLKDVDGERLLRHAGSPVTLRIDSARVPSTGCNVIARRGAGPGRVVLTAHVDARPGTPGALDDAAGVATLLAVAALLPAAGVPVEFAVLNGEDYYAASGELAYIAANDGRWHEIALAVNVDGAGYRQGFTASSWYACPDELQEACDHALAAFPGVIPGDPWVQGDHSLFVMHGVPALAFTSEKMTALWAGIAHTEHDRVELVDPRKLEELAQAIVAIVDAVARSTRAATDHGAAAAGEACDAQDQQTREVS